VVAWTGMGTGAAMGVDVGAFTGGVRDCVSKGSDPGTPALSCSKTMRS
jgi:hypothetical protein